MKSKSGATPKPDRALPAAKWIPILDAAGLTLPTLADAKTSHARAIKLGQWLSAKVGRVLPVSDDGKNGKAVLRVIGARANEKRYYFEITWERTQKPKSPHVSKAKKSKTKKYEEQSEKRKAVPKPACKGKTKTDGNNEKW